MPKQYFGLLSIIRRRHEQDFCLDPFSFRHPPMFPAASDFVDALARKLGGSCHVAGSCVRLSKAREIVGALKITSRFPLPGECTLHQRYALASAAAFDNVPRLQNACSGYVIRTALFNRDRESFLSGRDRTLEVTRVTQKARLGEKRRDERKGMQSGPRVRNGSGYRRPRCLD